MPSLNILTRHLYKGNIKSELRPRFYPVNSNRFHPKTEKLKTPHQIHLGERQRQQPLTMHPLWEMFTGFSDQQTKDCQSG